MSVFGDDYPTRDGTAIRDYIDVRDLASAHLLAIGATASAGLPATQVCNLGSGAGFSVREVLAAAEAVVARPIPVEPGPRREGDPPILVASAERARASLGWRPVHGTLADMIGSAWAWRTTHPDGYAGTAGTAAS